jgi:hypothetical protein
MCHFKSFLFVCTIIGGIVVGLSTVANLTTAFPSSSVTLTLPLVVHCLH